MRKILSLVLALNMTLPAMIFAQTSTAENSSSVKTVRKIKKKKPADPKLHSSFTPIDVQTFNYDYYDETSGWGVATATSYSYKGIYLETPDQYRQVIEPLNDPLANHYLNSAGDEDGWGQVLLWGGVGVETAGWTVFAIEMIDSSNPNNENLTVWPSVILILGGVGAIVRGVFCQYDAGLDRGNAVYRYNAVVKGDNGVSMIPFTGQGTTGLNVSLRF